MYINNSNFDNQIHIQAHVSSKPRHTGEGVMCSSLTPELWGDCFHFSRFYFRLKTNCHDQVEKNQKPKQKGLWEITANKAEQGPGDNQKTTNCLEDETNLSPLTQF